jgi:hypothetical protein
MANVNGGKIVTIHVEVIEGTKAEPSLCNKHAHESIEATQVRIGQPKWMHVESIIP